MLRRVQNGSTRTGSPGYQLYTKALDFKERYQNAQN
jgi:hypothetical protein